MDMRVLGRGSKEITRYGYGMGYMYVCMIVRREMTFTTYIFPVWVGVTV